MDMRIRFGVVFQQDGLDKDAVRDDLNRMGTVVDESDGSIENKDGIEVPVWVYLMDGDLAQFTRVKLAYNAESYNYMLFPRKSMETRSIFVD